jgi:uncharacterized protein DUF416
MRITFPDFDQGVMRAIDWQVDEEVRRLGGKLRSLNPQRRAAYCLGCCERLLPSYAEFHKATGVGDYYLLRKLVDSGWLCVSGDSASPRRDSKELDQVDFVLDEQSNELAVHAANAVHLTDTALACLPQCSDDMASQCYGIVMRDLIHFLLTSCLEIELPFSKAADFVLSGEKWKNEVRLHDRLVDALRTPTELATGINEGRAIAMNGGVSSIGLRLHSPA